jgi:ribonuclease-3
LTDESLSPVAPLDELEKALGYTFRDRSLLETAVTHSSWANENEGISDNERLEFLGDSVVGVVVAHLLFVAHPTWREGELTRALHNLVDRRGLAGLARRLSLGDYLKLGKTELQSDGRNKQTILADGIEAVLGAMYLDGGVEPVERLAREVFAEALEAAAPRVDLDPKTRFQEWVMARHGVFPNYRTVEDTKVEGHDERFTCEVLVGERSVARGVARSKREAERRAAAIALETRDEWDGDGDDDGGGNGDGNGDGDRSGEPDA